MKSLHFREICSPNHVTLKLKSTTPQARDPDSRAYSIATQPYTTTAKNAPLRRLQMGPPSVLA